MVMYATRHPNECEILTLLILASSITAPIRGRQLTPWGLTSLVSLSGSMARRKPMVSLTGTARSTTTMMQASRCPQQTWLKYF